MFGRINQRLPSSGLYVPADVLAGQTLVAYPHKSLRHSWGQAPRSNLYGVFEQDTFLAGVGTNKQTNTSVSGAGSTITRISSVDRQGVYHASVSALSAIASFFGDGGTGSPAYRADSVNWTSEISWWFKTPAALSNATDRYTLQAGLCDIIAGTSTYTLAAHYNDSVSANWVLRLQNLSGITDTISGLPFAVSTWYHVRIRTTVSNAILYLTQQGKDETFVTQYVGALSLGDMAPRLIVVKTINGTSSLIDVDVDGWEFWSSNNSIF